MYENNRSLIKFPEHSTNVLCAPPGSHVYTFSSVILSMVTNAAWICSLNSSDVFGSGGTKTRSSMCPQRKKALNQVIWGGSKGTKRGHPHQKALFRDAEVRRSGIDERECSNKGGLFPVGRKNPWNHQQVAKQPHYITPAASPCLEPFGSFPVWR
ncbi:hypothetical protein AVEN_165825-1 [Araneus ventricosus]|uniref:Uncharacterized protein n=1 Tax=Araneus ventricosus TaxID=182803 RepID=A0A4Y2EPY3_ARAVE|nr:hypothetical protein AVEN_165825-1 [Araneus ventricosus]